MLVLEDFGRGLGVVEELVDLLHLLSLHVLFTLNSAQQMSRRQQLQRISARKQDSIRMLGFSAEVLNLKWSLHLFQSSSSRTLYLRVVFEPISARWARASSLIVMPSVWARILMIWKSTAKKCQTFNDTNFFSIIEEDCGGLTCFISCGVYSTVRMIMTLSSKSRGIPCGELMSSVPLVDNASMLKPQICHLSRNTSVKEPLTSYLIKQLPLFDANTTMGAMELSSARWR